MLSELYRPAAWSDFVGQPAIAEIEQACSDSWLFQGCGERWLFESDDVAGCGKTSAAYVTARALGCSDLATERIDSRSCAITSLRDLERRMCFYGFGGNGRRAYILDEVHHLNLDCRRMLLGTLEQIPKHVIVIGTTTTLDWAADTPGLLSRWRRFRFSRPSVTAVATLLERIAVAQDLDIPPGFDFDRHAEIVGLNLRSAIDQLPDDLRACAVHRPDVAWATFKVA